MTGESLHSPWKRALGVFAAVGVALTTAVVALSLPQRHVRPNLLEAAQDQVRVVTEIRQPGRLSDPDISESSGLAPCLGRADAFWTHNDSGDEPRLFLVADDGRLLASVKLQGAEAVDWEDMCSFRWQDRHWLLVGDVGDNARRREQCVLYLLEEPQQAVNHRGEAPWRGEAPIAARIAFRYADGPRDCEAVAVSPAEQRIYCFSKELRGALYELELTLTPPARGLEAKRVVESPIPFATGMSLSADGLRMVILTYGDACEHQRSEDQTWRDAMTRPYRVLAMPVRRQGEAICHGESPNVLWLTSEGLDQPLWEVTAPE